MSIPTGICDRQVAADRIKGLLFGAVIGATLGLATDGMTKKEVSLIYTKDNPLRFEMTADGQINTKQCRTLEDIVDDNDFNSDIVEQLLVLQTIKQCEGEFFHKRYLELLSRYMDGDLKGLPNETAQRVRMSDTTERVVKHPKFNAETDSFDDAAMEVWRDNPHLRDTNGALIRATVLGIPAFWNPVKVMKNAACCCRVTHPDPHCRISCVIVSNIIARMLRSHDQSKGKENLVPSPLPSPVLSDTSLRFNDELLSVNKHNTDTMRTHMDELPTDERLMLLVNNVLKSLKPADDSLITKNSDTNPQQIRSDYEQFKLQWSNRNITLSNLELDGSDQHHVFKCLNASIYAFTREMPVDKEPQVFIKEILTDLVMQGGKAASNAAVAGALLGARFGHDRLPTEWSVSLRRWEWLYDIFEEFSELFFPRQ